VTPQRKSLHSRGKLDVVRRTKDALCSVTNNSASRCVNGTAYDATDDRNAFHQINDAGLSSFGNQPKPDFLVYLDKYFARNSLNQFFTELLCDLDTGLSDDFFASSARS